MSEPRHREEPPLALELVSHAVHPAPPTREQLLVEVHAARSQLAALRAVVEAQRAHIRLLLDQLRASRSGEP